MRRPPPSVAAGQLAPIAAQLVVAAARITERHGEEPEGTVPHQLPQGGHVGGDGARAREARQGQPAHSVYAPAGCPVALTAPHPPALTAPRGLAAHGEPL